MGIEITDPHCKEVWLEYVKVFADNTYQFTIMAGEPQYSFSKDVMDTSGNYLVTATYRTPGGEYLHADTTFRFDAG